MVVVWGSNKGSTDQGCLLHAFVLLWRYFFVFSLWRGFEIIWQCVILRTERKGALWKEQEDQSLQALNYYGRMPISCCVEPSYLFFSSEKERTNDNKPHTAPLTHEFMNPTSMERYITTEIDCRRRHHQELHLLLLITIFLPCFFCFFLCSLTTFFMSFFISSNCKASTSTSSKNLKLNPPEVASAGGTLFDLN